MTLTVREGALNPPVLETEGATSMELRDPAGRLVLVVLMLPGGGQPGAQSFMVMNCNDPKFAETVKGMGFKP